MKWVSGVLAPSVSTFILIINSCEQIGRETFGLKKGSSDGWMSLMFVPFSYNSKGKSKQKRSFAPSFPDVL